jgi:hypothetical protein
MRLLTHSGRLLPAHTQPLIEICPMHAVQPTHPATRKPVAAVDQVAHMLGTTADDLGSFVDADGLAGDGSGARFDRTPPFELVRCVADSSGWQRISFFRKIEEHTKIPVD